MAAPQSSGRASTTSRGRSGSGPFNSTVAAAVTRAPARSSRRPAARAVPPVAMTSFSIVASVAAELGAGAAGKMDREPATRWVAIAVACWLVFLFLEIVEWARQTFDEEEFLTRVREIEATGGLQLEDFIAEVEARARSR